MKLILASDVSKELILEVDIQSLTKKQKLKSASQKFFLFFGLALASLFVPVFHFVLVPAFLIIAVYMALKAYKVDSEINMKQRVNCVVCGEPLPTQLVLSDDTRVKCEKCFAQYVVRN